MSLVMKLCEIPGSKYVPKPEISRYCDCHKNENGIWDVLGFYTPQNKRITICDNKIEDYVKKLPEKDLEKIGLSRNELILFVRELVRLHEHGHAFLHTAEVGKKWQYNLPSEVNEPVTEFIVDFIIEKMGYDNVWINVFKELDKGTPEYYQNWSKIKDVLDNLTIQALKDDPRFIALLTGFVRSKEWKSWDEFLTSLQEYLDPQKVDLWIKELKDTINSAKKYKIYWFCNIVWYLTKLYNNASQFKKEEIRLEIKKEINLDTDNKIRKRLDKFEKELKEKGKTDTISGIVKLFDIRKYLIDIL
jgi:hypothetical protein